MIVHICCMDCGLVDELQHRNAKASAFGRTAAGVQGKAVSLSRLPVKAADTQATTVRRPCTAT